MPKKLSINVGAQPRMNGGEPLLAVRCNEALDDESVLARPSGKFTAEFLNKSFIKFITLANL